MTVGKVGDPAEAKNFKLLGHDPSAAWGGGSLVEIKNGFAYVGAVGGSWVAPPDAVEAGEWDKIARLARHAAALGPG